MENDAVCSHCKQHLDDGIMTDFVRVPGTDPPAYLLFCHEKGCMEAWYNQQDRGKVWVT